MGAEQSVDQQDVPQKKIAVDQDETDEKGAFEESSEIDEDDLTEGCAHCGKEFGDNITSALGKRFHPECFTCVRCGTNLGDKEFFSVESDNYCESCYSETIARRCKTCLQPVLSGTIVNTADYDFHPECFKCDKCDIRLQPDGPFFWSDRGSHPGAADGEQKLHRALLLCGKCFRTSDDASGVRFCSWCDEMLKEPGVYALGKHWHEECFACDCCEKSLVDTEDPFEVNNRVYCRNAQCVFEADRLREAEKERLELERTLKRHALERQENARGSKRTFSMTNIMKLVTPRITRAKKG